jgi:hypothetical protein
MTNAPSGNGFAKPKSSLWAGAEQLWAVLSREWSKILVDGDAWSGKTTLAAEIADRCGATVVSVDDHLLGNCDIYWNQIDYEGLESKILAAGPRVVIEGVCLLKVIGKIHVAYDHHVFIKLYIGRSGWECAEYLNEGAALPRSRRPREIIEYYREYRPFDKCDFLLERYA